MRAFEAFYKSTCLPAECDDERVKVGMLMCWQAALLHAAEIAENAEKAPSIGAFLLLAN